MTTLSLLASNCGRGRGSDEKRSDFGLNMCSSKDFFANDMLQNSIRNINGVRLRNRNKFCVIAKVGKGKKHDYPWPDDLDTNITSGHLAYLSDFKPLAEKPKPVTLAFEKPLVDLERKIIDVRRMADDTGLDFSAQITALENKYQQALKELYTHLTPIQRLNLARHPNRPTVLDHILNITDKWVELHGDRAGYDDPAIVTGIGSIDGKSYLLIGHQKGRNTKENIARNFAMPTPHGYRKALRMMKYADHHGLPIVTFVDTPGAFADLKSEELGQGEAIAYNLRAMFGFKVPIVSIVTGEGGSGGALAIACANKLFMLENSAFYVASPEACAAILWKTSQAAPKAAEKLKITAQEHFKRKIADGIIPEPLGGAHVDPAWTSQQIKRTIIKTMEELTKMSTEELLEHRRLKFRSIGGFQEGVPIDPKRKRFMKPSEVNSSNTTDLELELDNLKKKILETKGPSDPITSRSIQKLKQDVDQMMTNAFISMGLQEKLESLKLELSKTPADQTMNQAFREKADKLMQEFKHKLSQPGAYIGLKEKLEKLDMVGRLTGLKAKNEKRKFEINKKVPLHEVRAKMEYLKNAQEKLSKGDLLDDDLAREAEKVRRALKEALKAANLEILGVAKRKSSNFKTEIEKNVNEEIEKEIEKAIHATGLTGKIEEWKAKIAKGSDSDEVEKLRMDIKEEIAAALDASGLKEKFDNVKQERVMEGNVVIDNGKF